MEEARKIIFTESNKAISKLQLLSVFFEDELIFKIYIRTQVIHKLFESNPELDINKLQLFHLQFTDTIIELLRKIKKNNEKSISVAEDEIQVNEELIDRISNMMQLEEDFDDARQTQTAAVNLALSKLYLNLSNLSADAPFTKAIDHFSNSFSKDFFHAVDGFLVNELLEFDPQKVYKNGYGIIEKRLMGLQCKHEFKNIFYCGLKAENVLLEVYKLEAEDEYFLFSPAKKLFLSLDLSKIEGIDLGSGVSKKAKIVQELTSKNTALHSSLDTIKTNIPAEVNTLLNDYYTKIAAIDFLDFIDDFDVQANILKTMLNTNSL